MPEELSIIILTSLSKLIENSLAEQLPNFLKDNNVLSLQSFSRTEYGSTTTLLQITNYILLATDNSGFILLHRKQSK